MARKKITKTKIFNGKRYTRIHSCHGTKASATTHAKYMRGKGKLVRIVATQNVLGRKMYCVYVRKKGK